MATTTVFTFMQYFTQDLLIPIIVNVVIVSFVLGLAIKAMKAKDLVHDQ